MMRVFVRASCLLACLLLAGKAVCQSEQVSWCKFLNEDRTAVLLVLGNDGQASDELLGNAIGWGVPPGTSGVFVKTGAGGEWQQLWRLDRYADAGELSVSADFRHATRMVRFVRSPQDELLSFLRDGKEVHTYFAQELVSNAEPTIPWYTSASILEHEEGGYLQITTVNREIIEFDLYSGELIQRSSIATDPGRPWLLPLVAGVAMLLLIVGVPMLMVWVGKH